MKMSITDISQNTFTIELVGEFDAKGCKEIREELENTAALCEEKILYVDLSGVSFIDSSGIGAIVFLFKRVREVHGTLEIINAQGQPKELLTLLRVGEAIPIAFLGDDIIPSDLSA